jgi:hypothetical protein
VSAAAESHPRIDLDDDLVGLGFVSPPGRLDHETPPYFYLRHFSFGGLK